LVEILGRYVYVSGPFLAWLFSQVLKVVFYLLSEKQLNIAKLFDVGGMPSSHSALVVALVTIIGFKQGTSSPLFAVALFFAAVVIYDATNLRRAAGEHAQTLNKVIPDLLRGKFIQPYDFKALYETLGHNPAEVLVGSMVGFGVAWILVIGIPVG